MNYGWYDVIGNLGVAIIIISYFFLQLGKVDMKNVTYSISNAVGASLILISLLYEFNLSAFIVEGFWLLISVYGIFRNMNRQNTAQ